jgi:hypothetical protein
MNKQQWDLTKNISFSALEGLGHYLNGRSRAQNAVITGRNEAFNYRHRASEQLGALRSVGRERDERIREEDFSAAEAFGSLANSYAGEELAMSGSVARNLANAKLKQQLRRASVQNASTEAVHEIRMGAMMSGYMAKVAEIQANLAASKAKAGSIGAIVGTVGRGVTEGYGIYKGYENA